MAVTLKPSPHGIAIADAARRSRGWRKFEPDLIAASGLSEASFKRFWTRKPIQREKFIRLCETLELDWQDVVDRECHGAEKEDWSGRMHAIYAMIEGVDLWQDMPEGFRDTEIVKSLCRGWLYEMVKLMVQATESIHPEKNFFQHTKIIIHKLITFFKEIDKDVSCVYVEVVTKDEPGMLHDVTRAFKDEQVNIQQVYITSRKDGMAKLEIYCDPVAQKIFDALLETIGTISGVEGTAIDFFPNRSML